MARTARSFFLTSFLGRGAEIDELCTLAERARLVTLTGPGGVGKTRLSYELFDTLAPAYGDAAWVVELVELHDPAAVGPAIARAVGAPDHTESFDARALVAHFGSEPALLYLDNCEHLVEACADLLQEVLLACPRLHVIASSRQLLGITGEHVYPVPPLTDDDAVALFMARSAALLPDWTPDEQDRAAVHEVCVRLEGSALSIELAAALTRTLAPRVIRDQLSDQLSTLRAVRGVEKRHGSLEACLAWSFGLCTDDERTLLARLAVFPGPFSLDAASSVCGFDDLPPARVAPAIRGLVEKSLVERDHRDASGRYRLLEVVRQFAALRLQDAGVERVLQLRHRDHYLALVERFEKEWFGPGQLAWFDWFRVEQANLRAAFDVSTADVDQNDVALRLCVILEHHVGSAGGAGEALGWIRTATSRETSDLVARAEALRVGCFIACIQNALRTARALQADLAEMAAASDDERIRARSLYATATVQAWHGEPAVGAELAEEAIGLYAALGDDERVANLVFLQALMLGWADRPEEALLRYRRCFDLTDPRGERYWSSYAKWGLGVDRLLAGDVEEAVRLEREALATRAEFADPLGTGLTLETLAWAAVEQRNGPLATLLLGASSVIWAYLEVPLSGVPYLLRRRDQAFAALEALAVPDARRLHDLGAQLPMAQVVDIALGHASVPAADSAVALTRREREIATMLARGATNKDIATELFISPRTVESHVERILRKLDLRSRTEVREALASPA